MTATIAKERYATFFTQFGHPSEKTSYEQDIISS